MITRAKGTLINQVSYSISSYTNALNPVKETHIVILPPPSEPIQYQLDTVKEAYRNLLEQFNINPSHTVLKRVFCGDILNIKCRFDEFFPSSDNSNTMFIQQPPMPYRRFAIWVWFVEDDNTRVSRKDKYTLIERPNIKYYAFANLMAESEQGSYNQTKTIFYNIKNVLEENEMTLEANLQRTWIYVSDVDNNYAGMVNARKDLFNTEGLTQENHFIASTGIEGKPMHKKAIVSIDALAVQGLKKEQVEYVNAYDYLNNTADYGVTFERATALNYGDRKTVYVSGTASINKKGEVVHVGDIQKQTLRAIENIEALLKSIQAELNDVLHMIVYLRDPADHKLVTSILNECFGEDSNFVMVYGPVCRPEWLVEIEAIAIADTNTEYSNF